MPAGLIQVKSHERGSSSIGFTTTTSDDWLYRRLKTPEKTLESDADTKEDFP